MKIPAHLKKQSLPFGKKENYTFRLPVDLINDFNKICESEGITRTAVMEFILETFNYENRKSLSKNRSELYQSRNKAAS